MRTSGRFMLTRREFGKLTLAGFAVDVTTSTIKGVRLGVQTYSFRDLPRAPGGDAVDAVVRATTACGLSECELWAEQIEPKGSRPEREALRQWRVQTPLDHFRNIRKKFTAAGISIYAYNYSHTRDFTDAEIDRGFEIAKALGAQIITASTTLDVAHRIVPFAQTHRMVVAMHNHSNTRDPNEFATPESFTAALKMSRYFRVNLDIGHFTAAGFDAVAYLRERHASIANLHVKDMKKNQPDSYVPWGQGDTPVRAVLQLLKKERWPIRAYIEYEYRGQGTPVDEVKKCFAYAKQALA